MTYVVVYEQTTVGWSAYIPDPPGCVVAGETRQETEGLIREAIVFYLRGLRDSKEAIPEPGTWTEMVETPA